MSKGGLLILIDTVEHMVLDHVSWAQYQSLLEEFESRPGFSLTFDRGRLEIMSPLPEHESFKKSMSRLIELMSLELGIPIVPLGSTTFHDAAAEKGLEPDECYYVTKAQQARGMRGPFDPSIHPTPDLVIEVDITKRSIPREPIYASLDVPELWCVTVGEVECLHLAGGVEYRPAERSLAFPFLKPARLWNWVQRLEDEVDITVLREFRDWVRILA